MTAGARFALKEYVETRGPSFGRIGDRRDAPESFSPTARRRRERIDTPPDLRQDFRQRVRPGRAKSLCPLDNAAVELSLLYIRRPKRIRRGARRPPCFPHQATARARRNGRLQMPIAKSKDQTGATGRQPNQKRSAQTDRLLEIDGDNFIADLFRRQRAAVDRFKGPGKSFPVAPLDVHQVVVRVFSRRLAGQCDFRVGPQEKMQVPLSPRKGAADRKSQRASRPISATIFQNIVEEAAIVDHVAAKPNMRPSLQGDKQ